MARRCFSLFFLRFVLPFFCCFWCFLEGLRARCGGPKLVCSCFVSFFHIGGFKGHPSYFFFCSPFVCFVFLCCLPLKTRVFLLIVQCLPLFLPSLSHFPLSLSLSLLLVYCFLPSLFYLFFHSLFLVFLVGLFICFCFMQRTTSKDYILKVVSIICCCCLGFLFCFVFQIPFSYLYFLFWPHLA